MTAHGDASARVAPDEPETERDGDDAETERNEEDLDELCSLDPPVFWPGLCPEDASEEWKSLARWVGRLVERFNLDHHVVPRCWWQHNSHVEALAALRDHERASYADTAAPTAALEWHRALRDIEVRLRDWTGRLACGARHEPTRARPANDEAAWTAWVTADVAARRARLVATALNVAGAAGPSKAPFPPTPVTQQGPPVPTTQERQITDMAVKTIWNIEHACGHNADANLSDKRADQRAGFARWLATKDCDDCWRAQRDDAERRSKEDWLAVRRAEETAAIDAWERSCSMPELTGSDKAVQWARRCRSDLLTGAYGYLVLGTEMTEEDWEDRIEGPARELTAAAWWIDQRDSEPADIEELICAALSADGGDAEVDEVET
jgi:hypothetical protein